MVAATFASFWPVVGNDFVAWDDDYLLLGNIHIRDVSADSLSWMFTATLGGHYQPLTWLSYVLETKFLWSVNAAGFHFTNLALHVVTAIGLFLVIRQLIDGKANPPPSPLGKGGGMEALPSPLDKTGGRPTTASPLTKGGLRGVSPALLGATIAALLWAVHPLRVESVAWATERRDVLSGALLVWSVWFYLRRHAPSSRHGPWLAASLLCYVLSLLSKASGMTLPLVLFILDLFPLRRRIHRGVIVEKALYLPPALAAAALAAYAQADAGALRTLAEHPLSLRIAQALYGILFYLGKTLWPTNLVPLYEQRPEATATEPMFIACVVGVALLSVIAWRLRRTQPAILATWAAYLVLLSPMLGLAQSGPQVVADRYSYLPAMALVTLLAGAIVRVWNESRRWRFTVVAGGGLVVLLSLVSTRAQVGIWKDTRTLWETTLARRVDTPLARANFALELNRLGEFAQAETQARIVLERLPGNRTAHAALAHAALELGDLQTAEHHGAIALAIADQIGRPDVSTMIRMVVILSLLERNQDAEAVQRKLIEIDPRFADWHFDRVKREWAPREVPE